MAFVAGSIYPTLQLLEDMGCVKPLEQDGKKVYTITDEGLRFLEERGETMDKIKDHIRDWWASGNREELRETMHQLREFAHLVAHKARHLDREKLAKIRAIIAKAAQDIDAVLD